MTANQIEMLFNLTLEQTNLLSHLYQERKSKIESLLLKPNQGIDISKELKSICTNRLDMTFNNFISKNLNVLKLKYKYCNIPFSAIYVTKPKSLLNGSDASTRTHLYNAIKYQTLANWSELGGLSERSIKIIICFYGFKLLNNVNNDITYNVNGTISYNPITPKDISDFSIRIYDDIYNKKNYTVTDLNNQSKKLKLNFEYMKEKRFTKEELESLIETFNIKPTIKELSDKANESLWQKIYQTDNDAEKLQLLKSITSTSLMRKYIKMYELESLLNISNYKQK